MTFLPNMISIAFKQNCVGGSIPHNSPLKHRVFDFVPRAAVCSFVVIPFCKQNFFVVCYRCCGAIL